jgi:hypothetical protein
MWRAHPLRESCPTLARPTKTRYAAGETGPCGPILDLNIHIPTKVAVLANRLIRSASRYYRKRYGFGVGLPPAGLRLRERVRQPAIASGRRGSRRRGKRPTP